VGGLLARGKGLSAFENSRHGAPFIADEGALDAQQNSRAVFVNTLDSLELLQFPAGALNKHEFQDRPIVCRNELLQRLANHFLRRVTIELLCAAAPDFHLAVEGQADEAAACQFENRGQQMLACRALRHVNQDLSERWSRSLWRGKVYRGQEGWAQRASQGCEDARTSTSGKTVAFRRPRTRRNMAVSR